MSACHETRTVAPVAAQMDHLLQQGYERLAYLAIEEPRGRPFTEARLAAFHDICRTRGITGPTSATVSCDIESIALVLKSWTPSPRQPLGVVAWNDITALGIVSAATACGLQIPHDVGVIGGDDTAVAALARPSLSSVRFNLPAQAQGIAARIAAALGHQTSPQPANTTTVEVVARRSTDRGAQ